MFCRDVVRKAVIHYLHFTQSLRKVAAIYGASAASLSRWVRKETLGAAPPASRASRAARVAVQEAVRGIVANNAFRTLDEIVGQLRDSGLISSRSAVHRHLRRAGFSRKRVAHRFAPREPTAEAARDFLGAVRAAREVVSIDETSVVLEKRPLYGYAPKGTRPVHRSNKPPRGNRVTLLLAVSNTRGVIAHRAFPGSCNREKFADFLTEDVAARGAVVTLDNVRFHHSANVRSAAQGAGLQLLFTPPYSPDFNFIENAFSIVKSHTRRFDAALHLEDALQLVTPDKARALYNHMVRFVEAAAAM